MLMLLGWAGWTVVRLLFAKPGPYVDYEAQVIDLLETRHADDENGWTAYVKTLAAFDAVPAPEAPDALGRPSPTDLDSVVRGDFEAGRLEAELAYLADLREAGVFKALGDLSRYQRFTRPELDVEGDRSLIGSLAPDELAQARRLGKVRRASMRVAAVSGDWAEFALAFNDLLTLARAASQEPSILGYLLASSFVTNACNELALTLGERQVPESVCGTLLTLLDERVRLAPVSQVFECERLMVYDLIQRTHTAGGQVIMSRLGNVDAPPGPSPASIENLKGIIQANREETKQLADEYFDALIEQAAMSRVERANHPFDFDRFMNFTLVPHKYDFLSRSLPIGERAITAADAHGSVVNATRLLLAIEVYQGRHGRAPESLAEAIDEWRVGQRSDPVGCGPFGYVVREPNADDSRTFLLYSVGADGEDNGGVEPPLNDYGRRPNALTDQRGSAGYDYVFNRLREPAEER